MDVTIGHLSENQWEIYKEIRLEALKNDPIAFGSSYEEEINYDEIVWRSRIKDFLFAFNPEEKVVGLIAFLFNNRMKTKHRANIYSVYVRPKFRRNGIGKRLLGEALRLIKLNTDIIKVNLTVNPLQTSAISLYESFGFKKVGTLSKEIFNEQTFHDEDLMELFI